MATIVGGSPAQRELLEEILSGLGSDRIDTIELTPLDPADGWGRGERMFVDTHDVRTSWEAMLIAAAFRRGSARDGLPKVAVLAQPDGASTLSSVPPPLEPLDDSDVDAFRRDVEAAVRAAKLEVVEVLRPEAHAFALRARVDEPHAYLRFELRPFLEVAARWRDRCDGIYSEVVDEQPTPVLAAGWYRYGSLTTSREDVACCTPFTSGALLAPPPPRCPVFDVG
jgi:hypothetical protein